MGGTLTRKADTACVVDANLQLAAGKQLQQGGVDLIAFAATDRSAVRSEFATVDSALATLITTEKDRVDTILAGSSANLDTFIELSNAFASADPSLSGLVSAQTTAHNADVATINSTASFLAAEETWTNKKSIKYTGGAHFWSSPHPEAMYSSATPHPVRTS